MDTKNCLCSPSFLLFRWMNVTVFCRQKIAHKTIMKTTGPGVHWLLDWDEKNLVWNQGWKLLIEMNITCGSCSPVPRLFHVISLLQLTLRTRALSCGDGDKSKMCLCFPILLLYYPKKVFIKLVKIFLKTCVWVRTQCVDIEPFL